jgi:ATP-dependent Clp protease ATP-binding subunit ClpB
MDKFTIKSQEAIQEAQRLAERKGNQQLDAEHLLFVLLEDEEGVASQILKRIGINTASLKTDVEEAIDKFPKVVGATPMGQIYISPRLKEVFEKAAKEAEHLTDEYVSVEHLLLALVSIGGPCSDILKRYGASADKILSAMRESP